MKYNNINVHAHRTINRVGRGIAAGQGKTAGRGTKGQNARAGSSRKPGFEGGSNPLLQRLPKLPGFRSRRIKPTIIYTGQINKLNLKTIDNESLTKNHLISNPNLKVKLLVKGELTKAVKVSLQSASLPAIKMVEKAGGTFVIVEQIGRLKNVSK